MKLYMYLMAIGTILSFLQIVGGGVGGIAGALIGAIIAAYLFICIYSLYLLVTIYFGAYGDYNNFLFVQKFKDGSSGP